MVSGLAGAVVPDFLMPLPPSGSSLPAQRAPFREEAIPMSMKTMYWVSNISSWSYIDISGKTHGRIDWFEEISDMGYWWQTAHENGISINLDRAKRGVEEALRRRRLALAALCEPDREFEDQETGGNAAWSA
jgi:hypothetical protein